MKLKKIFKKPILFIKESGFLILSFFALLTFNQSFGYFTLMGLFIVCCFLTITMKKRTINLQEFLMLLFLFFYLILSSFNGYSYEFNTFISYFIAPFIYYQFGEYVAGRYKSDRDFILFWITVIICYSISTFYFGIDSIVSSGQIVGTDINLRAIEYTSFGQTFILNATVLGLILDIAMVGLPMFIIEKNNIIKVAYLVLFLLALAITLHMLNRTALVISVMALFAIIAYRYRSRISIFVLIISFLVFILYILVSLGTISDDLISIYAERNEDLSTAGNRTTRWSDAIQQLFMNPLGWGDGTIYYIHNMWLDIARISGLIPFIILIYFALKSFKDSFYLINRFNNSFAYLTLGLNVCFFASCFVEPIVGGTHLLLYCMLWGFQNRIIRLNFQIIDS